MTRADRMRWALDLAQWGSYVWRPHDGGGQHLVPACPICLQAKDVGHYENCPIKISLDEGGTVDTQQEQSVADMAMRLAKLYQAMGLLTTLHGSMEIDVDDPVGMAQQIHGYVTMTIERLQEQVKMQARWIDNLEARVTANRQEAEDARRERDLHANALELQRVTLETAYQDMRKAEGQRDRMREALVKLVGSDDPQMLMAMAGLFRMAPADEDTANLLAAIDILGERWKDGPDAAKG